MSASGSHDQPLVSIITPFYNTGTYLAQCIESVLAQSYENWEYILVNNCSTDNSLSLAETYARRDPRIQLHSPGIFLNQVQNYNRALRLIAPGSKYCKIVQADDWIFPHCISQMVGLAEEHPSIGIVASYWLNGTRVDGDGLPYPSSFLPGREAARWQLLNHPSLYIFGTPTSLLFRSDLIRKRQDAFYDESSDLEDLEICYTLLRDCDFGFVHNVLTFSRPRDESITAQIFRFNPYILHALIALRRHGSIYLTPDELQHRVSSLTARYMQFLAEGTLRPGGKALWRYHWTRITSSGLDVPRSTLVRKFIRRVLALIACPKAIVQLLLDHTESD